MLETVMTRVNDVDGTLTFEEWLDRGRKWWKARAGRVAECDFLLVLDAKNVVRAAGRVEGVKKDLGGGSGRIEILVVPDQDNKWLGHAVYRYSSRNPLVYVSEVSAAPTP